MASREVDALIAWIEATGLPHKVTDINTPGVHSAHSFHYAQGTGGVGLAVDLAGTTPGNETQMGAIFNAFKPVAGQLAELIHNGPSVDMVVKAGKWVNPIAAYGSVVWAAHKNHVHVATYRGVFLSPPSPPAPAMARTVTVPIPVHDFEEAAVKQTMMVIGPLDEHGRGWSDWDPGLGRDPNILAVTLLGPSPPDDGYWERQENVQLAAQPRAGRARVVVRGGQPGDTITCFVSVS